MLLSNHLHVSLSISCDAQPHSEISTTKTAHFLSGSNPSTIFLRSDGVCESVDTTYVFLLICLIFLPNFLPSFSVTSKYLCAISLLGFSEKVIRTPPRVLRFPSTTLQSVFQSLHSVGSLSEYSPR